MEIVKAEIINDITIHSIPPSMPGPSIAGSSMTNPPTAGESQSLFTPDKAIYYPLDYGDGDVYQYTVELIELDKIMISVFNSQTGITYKKYIEEDSEWFKSNIYIFRGEFNNILPILQDSLLKNNDKFPHIETETLDTLTITINYDDYMYPFELRIDIPKFVSKHGPIEDRLNSLEYQVSYLKYTLKTKIEAEIKADKPIHDNELYNSLGHLIYKGDLLQGKPHGHGIRYSDNSELILYEGEFKAGLYDGQGTKYEDTVHCFFGVIQKTYSEGGFCKGLLHGKITTCAQQGDPGRGGGVGGWTESTFNMGFLHGPQITFSEHKKKTVTTYKMGIQEGDIITFPVNPDNH
jgi:hypothetical protein